MRISLETLLCLNRWSRLSGADLINFQVHLLPFQIHWWLPFKSLTKSVFQSRKCNWGKMQKRTTLIVAFWHCQLDESNLPHGEKKWGCLLRRMNFEQITWADVFIQPKFHFWFAAGLLSWMFAQCTNLYILQKDACLGSSLWYTEEEKWNWMKNPMLLLRNECESLFLGNVIVHTVRVRADIFSDVANEDSNQCWRQLLTGNDNLCSEQLEQESLYVHLFA